jgi:hypothetical protein
VVLCVYKYYKEDISSSYLLGIKTMSSPANPLSSFMRQPKIYIRLPSEGNFWPEGSIEIPETGELAVYSMTAKDELMLKIPDALMNGQAVVDVIQHCIPAIKNAWMIPNIDLDILLIAIRLATYGEMMTTPVKFGDDLELEYQIDLRILMDGLMNQISWNSAISISDDLTIFVRPLNYRQLSAAALKTFETQKIMQVVNDDKMPEEDKIKLFQESFKKLTDTTLSTISDSISRIDSSQGSTEDPAFIKEFVDNIDKDMFNMIQKHLEDLKTANSIKPMTVAVTDEMREKGVSGDTVEIPITFDPTTFFV